MYLDDLMVALLGRTLSQEESALLRQLSAQGMAKVNTELSRGVPCEDLMAELRKVYRAVQHHRYEVKRRLPRHAHVALAALGRAPTSLEMCFVAEHCEGLEFTAPFDLSGALKKGNDWDACLDTFLDELVAKEQTMISLSDAGGQSLDLLPLTAVHCPEFINPHSFTLCYATPAPILEVRNRSLVLSPVMTWFNDTTSTEVQFQIPDDVALLLLGDTDDKKKTAYSGSTPQSNYDSSSPPLACCLIAAHPRVHFCDGPQQDLMPIALQQQQLPRRTSSPPPPSSQNNTKRFLSNIFPLFTCWDFGRLRWCRSKSSGSVSSSSTNSSFSDAAVAARS